MTAPAQRWHAHMAVVTTSPSFLRLLLPLPVKGPINVIQVVVWLARCVRYALCLESGVIWCWELKSNVCASPIQ